MTKTCKICGIEKPTSEFNLQKDTKDGLRSWCKVCFSKYCKRWRVKNPEQVKDNNKRWQVIFKNERKTDRSKYRDVELKRRYGINQEYFDRLLTIQDNKCAICDNIFTKIARIDHCHSTGKVRGLLCDRCNVHLGYYERIKNEPMFSEVMQKYLDRYTV